MEWLTNLLGMAKNGAGGAGSSPFGALGGGGITPPQPGQMPPQMPSPMPAPQPGAMPGQMPGQPPPMPAAPPVSFMNPTTGQPAATPGAPQPSNPQSGIPGLLGKLMSGQQGNNQGALMNQAMSMLKPPQMQPTQWMAPWQRR